MSEPKFDIIGIANPGQDVIIELDRLPETNHRAPILEYSLQGGGNVATALVMAANLGLKTSIAGIMGDDLFAQMNFEDFRYNHVDTSHIVLDEGKRTDFCLCIAERYNKAKEILSKPGDRREYDVTDLDKSYIQSAKILHIGYFTPAVLLAADWIHEVGGKVSIDAAYYRPEIYEHYDKLDIFIASEYYYNDMQQHIGAMGYEGTMRYIQKRGPEIVIFTFGPDGCRGLYGDHYFELPSIDVPVVDTVGAGDVFHGAYLYAYLQGKNPQECARFATGASCIKCTRRGGRAGIANLEVLNAFLERGVIDEAYLDQREAYYRHHSLKNLK